MAVTVGKQRRPLMTWLMVGLLLLLSVDLSRVCMIFSSFAALGCKPSPYMYVMGMLWQTWGLFPFGHTRQGALNMERFPRRYLGCAGAGPCSEFVRFRATWVSDLYAPVQAAPPAVSHVVRLG